MTGGTPPRAPPSPPGARRDPRSKFATIASPLHNAFLRCLQPRGAIVLDPVPACDKLGSSRIDDRHELLPGDRRSPSTTVVTIGGERHLLGPAPVLSRLSCFIAMSSYGGDALIAFLCTQLDLHGHRMRGAKDLFALSSISAATCAAARTCDAHMLITSIYLTDIQLASLASLAWPCCASSHRMQPYSPRCSQGRASRCSWQASPSLL